MESPSDGRCKRSAGPKWRCGEAASPGKSYCERHLLQRKNQNQKRRIQRNEGDEESEHRSNNTRRRRRRRQTVADDLSSGSELEASDSELIGNFARNQRLKKKMIDQVSSAEDFSFFFFPPSFNAICYELWYRNVASCVANSGVFICRTMKVLVILMRTLTRDWWVCTLSRRVHEWNIRNKWWGNHYFINWRRIL